MSEDSYHVEIPDVTLVSSTSKSGRFRLNGQGGRIVYIGWDIIDEGSVDRDGDTGTLIIPRWLAIKERISIEA